ncbi:MAG: putative transporter, partial [Conexibacter sp.]|nr:putative transporter [Conexibacter sp.]
MPRPPRRLLSPLTLGLGALATGAVIAALLVVGTDSPGSTVRERTVTVAKGVVQSTVSGSGNLSPANQTEMSFGASGRVTKVYVKAGQHVTTGQLLAKIDTADADVALAQARADLSS